MQTNSFDIRINNNRGRKGKGQKFLQQERQKERMTEGVIKNKKQKGKGQSRTEEQGRTEG